MATHPGVLVAYDDNGNIVATRDWQVSYDESGRPVGIVDFAAHEEAGGEALDIWSVSQVIDGAAPTPVRGSKVWPEYLGGRFHDFRVELVGPPGAKRINALVHKTSGVRRERATVESAIQQRIAETKGEPADIRDLVGGPDRPILLDDDGRAIPRVPSPPSSLPLVRARPV